MPSRQWDAIVLKDIPEIGAVRNDVIVVRPNHVHPVLVVKRLGREALDHIDAHRDSLDSRQEED